MDKSIDQVTNGCHLCTSLRHTPKDIIKQSSEDPPAGVGTAFAADVMRRNRQAILVLRECVTSFTAAVIIHSERQEDLRDALLTLSCELRPLKGPPAVIRVDPAPGFQALANDELLRKYHVQLEIGRIKNINKNPIAEKAVQELEAEITRQEPRGDVLSKRKLAVIISRLNTRIRGDRLSAREMWFQRDQYTNEQIPMQDLERIRNQQDTRVLNHPHIEKSKHPGDKARTTTQVAVGDIVYIYTDYDKHKARERYIVVETSGEWCNV